MVENGAEHKGFQDRKNRAGSKKEKRRKKQPPSIELPETVPFKDYEERHTQGKKQHNKFILMEHLLHL